MRTLLITGWTVDFACSAVLIRKKNPDADIIGMSKGGLPKYLRDLAGNKGLKYDKIHILGIPLNVDEKMLIAACKKLHAKNIELLWLCSYPLPRKIPIGIDKYITIPSVKKESRLCRLTADHFKISRKILFYQSIEQIANCANGISGTESSEERMKLIEAAMSRYRRFQDADAIINVIKFLSEHRALEENEKQMLDEYNKHGVRELKGSSPAIREIQKMVRTVGEEGRCGVLITGETGTGKESVAYLTHGHSPRKSEPFIAFNCADLTPHLLESRLFGHEKGAFTGAEKCRQGAFELADGGTLFLDEVGELPLDAQAGLLRVLQEGRFFKLGGEKEAEVNVRIIAATNRNLREMINQGTFREDLFYRLNVINIHIPPLRERIEDIKPIADSYLLSRKKWKLNKKQTESLEAYEWSGNVRELQNFLERSIVLREYDYDKLLDTYKKSFATYAKSDSDLLEESVRNKVNSVFEKDDCNKTHAAKALGISINTLKKHLGPY